MIDILPGLTEVDSLVMKLSCEKAIEIGDQFIDTKSILAQAKSLGIHPEEFFETLEILDKRGYIEATRVHEGNIPLFSITVYGFDKYARIYLDDYDSVIESVAFQIVNFNNVDNKSISTSLNQSQMIVDHIFDVLENKGLIRLSKTFDGVHIWDVSPELKRMLRKT
jgi:hypothetical protein